MKQGREGFDPPRRADPLIAGVVWFVVSPIVAAPGERAWSESRGEALRRSIGERKARLYFADRVRIRREIQKQISNRARLALVDGAAERLAPGGSDHARSPRRSTIGETTNQTTPQMRRICATRRIQASLPCFICRAPPPPSRGVNRGPPPASVPRERHGLLSHVA